MNLAEIRALVEAHAYNQPLPQRVDRKCLILSLTASTCCHSKELLVQSRLGGFVSRDCLSCGSRSNYVALTQIPDLDCVGCLKSFNREATVEPVLTDRNYWYMCTGCRNWEIAAIIPFWSEAFEYAGLAAPGDPTFLR
jgi:hypothetical protein